MATKWVDYKDMLGKNLQIIDSRGKKIAWVRAFKETPEGVYVKTLVPIRDKYGSIVKCALNGDEAVEAEFFLKNGKIANG